jgi:hypothetical protein
MFPPVAPRPVGEGAAVVPRIAGPPVFLHRRPRGIFGAPEPRQAVKRMAPLAPPADPAKRMEPLAPPKNQPTYINSYGATYDYMDPGQVPRGIKRGATTGYGGGPAKRMTPGSDMPPPAYRDPSRFTNSYGDRLRVDMRTAPPPARPPLPKG